MYIYIYIRLHPTYQEILRYALLTVMPRRTHRHTRKSTHKNRRRTARSATQVYPGLCVYACACVCMCVYLSAICVCVCLCVCAADVRC